MQAKTMTKVGVVGIALFMLLAMLYAFVPTANAGQTNEQELQITYSAGPSTGIDITIPTAVQFTTDNKGTITVPADQNIVNSGIAVKITKAGVTKAADWTYYPYSDTDTKTGKYIAVQITPEKQGKTFNTFELSTAYANRANGGQAINWELASGDTVGLKYAAKIGTSPFSESMAAAPFATLTFTVEGVQS